MLTGCRFYRPRLIELARGTASAEDRRELEAHVEVCAGCARALDEQVALSAALDALAGAGVPQLPAVEAGLLSEFERASVRRRMVRWVPVVGLAAAALLGVVLVQHRTPVARPQVREEAAVEHALLPPPAAAEHAGAAIVQVGHKRSKRPAVNDDQPFLPIPYTVPLGPEERTTIVRMEIPVAALIAVGFDVPAVDSGTLVLADVLVGQDGRARAIRPVRSGAGK